MFFKEWQILPISILQMLQTAIFSKWLEDRQSKTCKSANFQKGTPP